MRRRAWIGWMLVALLHGCGERRAPPPTATGPAAVRSVRIAAAADLQFALEEVVAAFRTAHPGIGIETVYGSSGTFYAQIAQGGPFDLYLSADKSYPAQLAAEGHADPETLFDYAIGRIVVWVPKDSPLDPEAGGLRILLDPRVTKVAIADPRHAPYGRAAVAALEHAGLWSRIEPRTVKGTNISQAFQFVSSGAAQVGIVALPLALAPQVRASGRFWMVPGDSYPRMEQAGVVIRKARDPAAARQVRAFLRGAEGRVILSRFGFLMPGQELP